MSDNGTTELREKLDALGIEHLDSDLPNNKQTRWNKRAGGWGACYVEITHNSILPADSIIDNRTLRIYDCTPEQAIAATLGSGKLTSEQVEEAVYRNCKFYEGGEVDIESITDELNAALGSEDTSRYDELFGTPERAASTLARMCAIGDGSCAGCSMYKANLEHCWSDYTHLKSIVEWLRGDAE